MALTAARSLLRACPRHRLRSQPRAVFLCRGYATHRDPMPTSSLLSQALDQKRRAAGREDSVGPFQLGLIPPTPQDAGDRKKWSELNAGGKGTPVRRLPLALR